MNILIYTLDWCPYCKKALAYFNENNIKYEQIPIDNNEEKYFNFLKEKYNLKGEPTVPQIIINEKLIGGYSDLMEKIQSNELHFDNVL